jgi:hypothetical protein
MHANSPIKPLAASLFTDPAPSALVQRSAL